MTETTGETGAMEPNDLCDTLRLAAVCLAVEGREEQARACADAARLLQTLADPRFLTLMRWPAGQRNATAFRARCHLPRDTYNATSAGGADPFAALRALAELLDEADAAPEDGGGQ